MKQLPFSLMLAARYLRPKRMFLWIISGLSVLGIMASTMLLIIVLSVMNGFGEEIKKKILGFDAHMIVRDDGILYDWRETIEIVEQDPDVVATSPFMLGPVIAEARGMISTPKIRGVDPETESLVSELKEAMIAGEYNLDGEKALIGVELANQMQLSLGDKITVYAPGNFDEFIQALNEADETGIGEEKKEQLKSLVLPQDLEVAGIFQAGRYNYDAELIYVPLWLGQELYRLQDGVHGIAIKTKDAYQVAPIQDRLFDQLPPEKNVLTWGDLNRSLLEAVRVERNLISIILFVVVGVAGLLIASVLIVVTVLKTKEIGILKALGARQGQILLIFLLHGMMLGLIGVTLGAALGSLVVAHLNNIRGFVDKVFHVDPFPQSIYQLAEIPTQMSSTAFWSICIGAFLISSVASLIPAFFAAMFDPVKALRQE